ncbi:MAG: type II secretion system protein [Thermoguttaceae bacterium]|jgi:prepilin-type processing-associated H-X9-DG protein
MRSEPQVSPAGRDGCRGAPRREPRPGIPGSVAGGFTIVELLVVIGVLGMLIGLLLPAIVAARGASQRTACLHNLREIGMVAQIYVNAHDHYPPAWINSTCRWMDLLKSCMDKTSDVYQCPSDPKKIPCTYDPTITLSYGINSFCFVDQAHCFWYTVKSYDVLRPSNVILFADCTPGNYWCGGGGQFSDPVAGVDYRHPGGMFNVAYADGRAESRTDTTQSDWDAAQ